MRGRRRPDLPIGTLPDDIQPGDYWKVIDSSGAPAKVVRPTNLTGEVWHIAAPIGENGWSLGRLELHTVREHEDGTISVRPGDGSSNSILVTGARNRFWHGYIEHGVWRDC